METFLITYMGSETLCAYELAHGFAKLLTAYPAQLDGELFQAQKLLEAKTKLTRTLCSKSPKPSPVALDDMVELYIKQEKEYSGAPRMLCSVLTALIVLLLLWCSYS